MFINVIPYICDYIDHPDLIHLLSTSSEILHLYNDSKAIKHILKSNDIPIPCVLTVLQICKWLCIKKHTLVRYRFKNNGYSTPNPVSIYEVFWYVRRKMDFNYNIWNNMINTSRLHDSKIYGYSFHGLTIDQMNDFITEMCIYS